MRKGGIDGVGAEPLSIAEALGLPEQIGKFLY
jgi:hypothetical protein